MITNKRFSATLRAALIASFVLPATLPAAAIAGTDSGTLNVSVTVQEVCSVDGGSLDFGAYNGGQANAADGSGSISYAGCAAGSLSFALDGGTSGDTAARTLVDGDGNDLAYQLYRNAARTLTWGNGADAMGMTLLFAGSGSIPVYGRIPGGQQAPAGTYTDAVNVTLTF